MPFEIWTPVGPRKHVLDGSAYWHRLANTTELSMCSGDAALCQITLTTCYLWTIYTQCVIHQLMHTTVLWPFFLDHQREPVPEESFTVLGRITRGRHTDNPGGRHSIRTNQQSTSINPTHFYAGRPSCRNPPNLSWLGTGTGICWIAHPRGLIHNCPRSDLGNCAPKQHL